MSPRRDQTLRRTRAMAGPTRQGREGKRQPTTAGLWPTTIMATATIQAMWTIPTPEIAPIIRMAAPTITALTITALTMATRAAPTTTVMTSSPVTTATAMIPATSMTQIRGTAATIRMAAPTITALTIAMLAALTTPTMAMPAIMVRIMAMLVPATMVLEMVVTMTTAMATIPAIPTAPIPVKASNIQAGLYR